MQAILTSPHNPTTGKEYSGGNVQRLVDAMDSNPSFASAQFATFRQWLTVGRCVIKGQHACARLLACGTDALGKTKECKPGEVTLKRGFVKGFSVFAMEQTAEMEDMPTADRADPIHGNESTADTCEVLAQHMPEHKAAVIRPNLSAATLRAKAASLTAKASACHADRLTNTAKRLAQAMGKRMEGDRYAKAASMLNALADAVDADPASNAAQLWTVPEAVKAANEAACYETRQAQNGYHSYLVETDKPRFDQMNHRLLRALLDPAAVAASSAKSAQVQAEAELRQCDFPGFFPTPAAVVRGMLEYAGDLTGKSVLEPSAGKGDLVQAAFDAGARVVSSFELVPKLADYLARFVKVPDSTCAHVTQNADFVDKLPSTEHMRVDVVLMNPPFERDQAPAHVLHALSWLKPGGRLVSVMPAGWSEKKSADYLHQMIADLGLSIMEVELDAGSFAGADAFRQTSVRTSLAVIS